MTVTQKRSAELFEELVATLVDEGMETGEFEIDSMRFAQMETLGHGLGKELSRRVQAALAARQGERMPDHFPCPQCGGDVPGEKKPKPVSSLDGKLEILETHCLCKKCRRAFFPSA